MYCQYNSKREERQLNVNLFCASTVRGKTDNKTQCPSSWQCSLAAYPLLQAEETRNENCGINQSKKCKKCMNAKSPNTQQKISEHISSAWLAGSPPAITCHMKCLNKFLCNSYAFCRIWCVVEGALNSALEAFVDHSTNLCEMLKRCFIK